MILTHFQSFRLAVLLTSGAVLGGCCATPAQGTTALEQRAVTPTEAVLGQLPTEAIELASPDHQVQRLRLRVNGQGAVTELALYHGDETIIPEPVRATAEERFPGGQVRYFETEWYAEVGQVFEIELTTSEGVNCEVSAAADGSLRYVECPLPLEELPEAITAAASRLVPDGELEEAEYKEYADRRLTHVEVRKEGLVYYLIFDSEGQLVDRFLQIPTTLEVPWPGVTP
jgi:hypothetical protein